MEIKRYYRHATYGEIGAVTLTVPDEGWSLDGHPLDANSIGHLAMFALQTLQDAYASSKNADEAIGAWTKKYEKLLAGEIGIRAVGPRDPVRKRALEIAARGVTVTKKGDVFVAAKGDVTRSSEDRTKALMALTEFLIDRNPAYRHLAEKQIAEEIEIGEYVPDDDEADAA